MALRDRIWVIDDDHSIRWVLDRALKNADFDVELYENGNSIMGALKTRKPNALIVDIRMPGVGGIELLKEIQTDYPDLPVIIMTAHSDLDTAVTAYQKGAFEYLPKPFDVDEAVELARRACRLHKEAATAPAPDGEQTPEIIGESPAMQEVFRAVGRLSRSDITVMINGASGTGKELVARALHRHSPRAQNSFIAINTAAIPKDLLESELFGHEKGAFTGAQALRRGRFEQADGGTLFLDEIGDMPAELQTRLLRVLSDGEYYRVGGHMPIKANVRIIAATHQDLEQRVSTGQFREDLFHRLNVIRVHLPALRERRDDIPLLLNHFVGRAAAELNVEPKKIRPEVAEFLSSVDWPGNVRQLENMCRWLMVMASGREIHLEDLPREIRSPEAAPSQGADWRSALTSWTEAEFRSGASQLLDRALPMFEHTMIEAALARTGGRRQEAAKLLGWGRNTLTRKIKEMGMDTEDRFREEE